MIRKTQTHEHGVSRRACTSNVTENEAWNTQFVNVVLGKRELRYEEHKMAKGHGAQLERSASEGVSGTGGCTLWKRKLLTRYVPKGDQLVQ